MQDHEKLQVEKYLALAHRALWIAAGISESFRDQGMCDDLYDLAMEVGRINIALLTKKSLKTRP